jgi:hypothetical protein
MAAWRGGGMARTEMVAAKRNGERMMARQAVVNKEAAWRVCIAGIWRMQKAAGGNKSAQLRSAAAWRRASPAA